MYNIAAHLDAFNHYKPLLFQLVSKDIKLKYRRSVLGYAWSILSPLLMMVIMTIVFSNFFVGIDNYPVYLIIGQTVFNFVSDATNQAMWSITGNAALLKKTYVPKYIFTLSKVTSSFLNTVFALGAMIIVFIACRVKLNVYMLFIPLILIQTYIFCAGLGLLLAQGTVFFRDIQYIYSAFLMAWMYLTPIFYSMELLPDYLKKLIINYNPIYFYIAQFRMIVLQGVFPDGNLILRGSAVAVGMMVIGTIAFIKTQDKFILYI